MTTNRLTGVPVIVTAGGTREAIDPVRYLGNRSSGKMGNALSIAARDQGAIVTLITTVAPPYDADGIEVVAVESAAEMHVAVENALKERAVLVMAAAVADYRPSARAGSKLKKQPEGIVLELVLNIDILSAVRARARELKMFVVGFAAETDDLLANAVRKLKDKGLDLIVVNDVSKPGIGMGADDNAVTVIGTEGIIVEVDRAPKLEVARAILDVVGRRRLS